MLDENAVYKCPIKILHENVQWNAQPWEKSRNIYEPDFFGANKLLIYENMGEEIDQNVYIHIINDFELIFEECTMFSIFFHFRLLSKM